MSRARSAPLAIGVFVIAASGFLAAGGASVPASATSYAPTSSFATSTVLDGSTYAAIPMGNLGDPLNTFWQLFKLSNGASRWSLDTPTGVADNGGLVIEQGSSASISVAIRPSDYLTFTPVAARGPRSAWASDGLIPAGLVAAPDAFVGENGTVFAAVESRGGSVLRAGSAAGDWTTVGTASSLSGVARGQCRVEGVEALAVAPSQSLYAGTVCSAGARAGIFALAGARWRDIGPSLGAPVSGATRSVVGLEAASGWLSALIATNSKSRTQLVLTRSSDGGSTWSTSKPLVLPASAQIVSVGSMGSTAGAFAVWKAATGVFGAVSIDGQWTALPSMPNHALTLAFPVGTTRVIDAVGGQHSTFLAWRLDPRAHRWDATQTMEVPIIYGSSG